MEPPRFSSPRREESKQSKVSKKTKETKKSVGFEKVFEDEEAHITSSQQSPSVKDSELSFEEADDLSEDEEDRKIKAIKENVRRKMSEEDSYEDSEYSSLPESYMDSQDEGARFSVAYSILTPKERTTEALKKSPPPEDLIRQLPQALQDTNSLRVADPGTQRR